jgi:hypothetical protein
MNPESVSRVIEEPCTSSTSVPHHPRQSSSLEQPTLGPNPLGNRQSSLSFLSPYLPKYFSSEWSFAYFKLPVETRCIAGFSIERKKAQDGADDAKDTIKEKVVVIGYDGSVYIYSFDEEKGGEATMDAFHWYIKDDL